MNVRSEQNILIFLSTKYKNKYSFMSSNFILEFTFWTKDDINNLISDKYGCLWVANWNGLNSYSVS
jgi:ligand-binding sensor domain-containing protein